MDTYSHILKLCSSNKVNAKNTWDLNMIDNIDEILVAQRIISKSIVHAERSVQIYEKRVDSTHTDTFKMLERDEDVHEALAQDSPHPLKSREINLPRHPKRWRKTQRRFSSSEEVDREFEVDPLFKRMSKAFDEGGARGMLLNHLGVHDGYSLIFDTSEAMAFPRTLLNAMATTTEDAEELPPADTADDTPSFDVTALKEKVDATFSDIANTLYAPELGQFRAAITQMNRSNEHTDDDADSAMNAPIHANDDDDDIGDVHGFDDDEFDNDDNEYFNYVAGNDNSEDNNAPKADSRAAESFRLACIEEAFMNGDSGASGSRFAFFNAENVLSKSSTSSSRHAWAGPSHWKFPGQARTRSRNGIAGDTGVAKKVKKTKDFIDFFAPAIDPAEAFAPPKDLATIRLKNTKATRGAEEANVLPVDVHYEAISLRRLFLRPSLAMLGRIDSCNVEVDPEDEFQVVDAPNELQLAVERDDSGIVDHDTDDVALGFDVLTLSDNEDDEDDADALNDSFDPSSMLNMVDEGRQVGKIDIAYAKRAKKVDVKKLKRRLWNHLQDTVAAPGKEDDDMNDEDAMEADSEKDEEEKEQAASFTESIERLRPELASNITVPFYFICLLHLANEKGLKLDGSDDLNDFKIEIDDSAAPAC